MATKKSIYISILSILIIAAWLLGSAISAGAKTYTVKCRETGHQVKMHIIEVGDVPSHIIGVGENAGVLSCEDGSVATTSAKWMSDIIKGSATAHFYGLATYEDGATTWYKGITTVTPNPDGKTARWEGTYEYIKGTGRFEGIQGSVSYTGKRLTPLGGAGAQWYFDAIITYTLPSK